MKFCFHTGERMWSRGVVLCAAVVSWGLAGCGGDSGPDLVDVSGTITMTGSPVVDAQVQFTPSEGRPSFGTTDASGKYRLEYTPGQFGAVAGKHRVSIAKTVIEGEFSPGEEPENNDPIPETYNTNSTIFVYVSNDSAVHDFTIEK